MKLEDVLKLRRGSVIALDKLAGDPVDIYINGRLIYGLKLREEAQLLNGSGVGRAYDDELCPVDWAEAPRLLKLDRLLDRSLPEYE